MTRHTASIALVSAGAALLIGIAGSTVAQTVLTRPKTDAVNKMKTQKPGSTTTLADKGRVDSKDIRLPTQIELLEVKVAALEAKFETRAKGLEAKIEQLRTENAALKEQVNRHDWDLYKPGGQIGMKLKVTQKATWDRVPGDAWVVYYQR